MQNYNDDQDLVPPLHDRHTPSESGQGDHAGRERRHYTKHSGNKVEHSDKLTEGRKARKKKKRIKHDGSQVHENPNYDGGFSSMDEQRKLTHRNHKVSNHQKYAFFTQAFYSHFFL